MECSIFFLNRYLVTLFHGQIVPSQIVPLNSHIVPQYSQKFSQVFKPWAETRVLLMYIPHFLSNKPKKACFTSSFTLKLWNDLTKKSRRTVMGRIDLRAKWPDTMGRWGRVSKLEKKRQKKGHLQVSRHSNRCSFLYNLVLYLFPSTTKLTENINTEHWSAKCKTQTISNLHDNRPWRLTIDIVKVIQPHLIANNCKIASALLIIATLASRILWNKGKRKKCNKK